MSKLERNATCPCGSGKKYKHCCLISSPSVQHPPAVQDVSSTWFNRAVQFFRTGEMQQAANICQQIIQARPAHADALHLLGLASHQMGGTEQAIDYVRRAIAARPTDATYHANLGHLFKTQNRLGEALACLEAELRLTPELPDVLNRLGSVLRESGRFDDAEACLRRAIAKQPDFADAHNNLGNVLQAKKQIDEAINCYQKAIAIDPKNAEANNNLGKVLLDLDRPEEAIAAFQRAVQIKPTFTTAYRNLGKVFWLQGSIDKARDALHKNEPDGICPSTAIKLAMMLPPIMGSITDISISRQELSQSLDDLYGKVFFDDPIKEDCPMNFYLAFHGLNDKYLQEKIAHFYAKACPNLRYTAPHCNSGNRQAVTIKIGFYSKFIFTHSVSRAYAPLIKLLSGQELFELKIITTQDTDVVSDMYAGFNGEIVKVSNDIFSARSTIQDLELDILVYLDIGMEPMSYFLAFARLAPVQCVMGGHPVTTGIATLDYYLSSDRAEPEDAQNHYTEKLIRFPVKLSTFERPANQPSSKSRAELGLPVGATYLCPMALQKIHPDFDEAIDRILQLDPDGYVVLFEDKKYSAWRGLLERRFERTISDSVRNRIMFLAWIDDYRDFMRIVELADVVLDTFHFGIGTTAIATCAVGTPYVTKPGEFLRGRVGLFFCQWLGVMDCVALDTEDYAQKAVLIATNPTVRAALKERIIGNSATLFEDTTGVEDLFGFFKDTARPYQLS
jgi:predicted O-linked N-acetylglucosamine transferase (SPINDLY family)